MSMNAKAVAQAYLQTWNEVDPAQREARLQQSWTDDATYVDPLMNATGRVGIGRLVGAMHERFPGFRFELLGTPDGHGDFARLRWSLGPVGAEPPIEGSDTIRLADGRIAEVIGFIDKAPAAA